VVADAVFDTSAHRRMIEAAAQLHGAPFRGVWLEAAAAVLRERVAGRPAGTSDADLAILDIQLAKVPDTIEWRKLDAEEPIGRLVERIHDKTS
jgi:predicted kinase